MGTSSKPHLFEGACSMQRMGQREGETPEEWAAKLAPQLVAAGEQEYGSPVGTAPGLSTKCLHGISLEQQCDRCAESYGSSRVLPPRTSSPPVERKLWGDVNYDKIAPSDPASMWRRVQMLCRDHDRLAAEIARLEYLAVNAARGRDEAIINGRAESVDREAAARADEREACASLWPCAPMTKDPDDDKQWLAGFVAGINAFRSAIRVRGSKP